MAVLLMSLIALAANTEFCHELESIQKSSSRNSMKKFYCRHFNSCWFQLPENRDVHSDIWAALGLFDFQVMFGWNQGQTVDPRAGNFHFLLMKPLLLILLVFQGNQSHIVHETFYSFNISQFPLLTCKFFK